MIICLWYKNRPFVREPYIFSRSLSGKNKMMTTAVRTQLKQRYLIDAST
jgi:hypothetical protein